MLSGRKLAALILATISPWAAEENLFRVVVDRDDFKITTSCTIEFPPGVAFRDANSNGIVHIAADNIRVRFANNTELCGAPLDTPWNNLTGIGVRIDGHKNVTIENARVRGFKTGIVAINADGLTISDADFSDNYRQRLKSTRVAESNEDWLFPHNNDRIKWRDQYGGAISIENSSGVTIRDVKVRRGQNGILLDRVTDSFIYDNDCSFLSGWGLALWRSSRNTVTRNAFDYCVRGHFEDAYNRGQDSAGILCFEQSNENVFAENSVTHGGDGFFGFAGHEAIGETWWKEQRASGKTDAEIIPPPTLVTNLSELGCNRNLLIDNDFSHSSVHGIEITFSEDNQIIRNRIWGNGLTGIWGGYCSRTLIAKNNFGYNGGMGFGLERGAINMEHASHNLILNNHFKNDRCGIHLWWDDDGALMRYPGVAGNNPGIVGNIIAKNEFEYNNQLSFKRMPANVRQPIIHIRDATKTHTQGNLYIDNDTNIRHPLITEFQIDEGVQLYRAEEGNPGYTIPRYKSFGKKRPISAIRFNQGRPFILMDEWGPKESSR